ncbi:MAG: tetratricopeptide repeat protein [Gemmatimonadetes bacterium]|nr:tetratricopeptide repeat protein [Gemmatimonadota bacterium]MBT6145052.1 tetratricopeptide repeat protein [Gemmatimonadota bacterium]MBT7862718.1 tetratricopeptide repeat protein [Gemmatimonadota bacterium]
MLTPLRTRLNPPQRRLLTIVVALGVVMLADTVYLLLHRLAEAAGWVEFVGTQSVLPKFYQAMILSHTGVGVLLVVLAAAFVEWHLPQVWRRHRRRAITTGLLTVVFGATLLITGLFILTEANSRDNAWAWWMHVLCAALVLPVYVAHRQVSIWKPSGLSYRVVPAVTAGLTALAILGHVATFDDSESNRQRAAAGAGPGSRAREIGGSSTEFVPANFVPHDSPFFPAATTTTTGGFLPSRIITRTGLPEQEMLDQEIRDRGFAIEHKVGTQACERCHAATVAQWEDSAHRFASFNNPFYEATLNDLRSSDGGGNAEVSAHIDHFSRLARAQGEPGLEGREGMIKSKWCSGCHDPALMLAGKMSAPIDRRTPQAQAGLTCLACHAIDHIHNNTGNGNYNIADEQDDPYLFAEADEGMQQLFHDTALKARPTVHKQQMFKPFFRSSEFCATCHKVSVDTRINDYRWLRGQDEYDNWHDSGVSLNASRTFYLPPYKRVCQDCHMPPERAVEGDVSAKGGYIRSHRFVAANTALPYLRGDTDTIERIEHFLQDEKLRIDVFALRRADGQVVHDLDTTAVVAPGEQIEVDVVVRNQGVGHTFPGGTNDSNEGWIEFTVRNAQGHALRVSGAVGEDGHVDQAAHFYKALLVDRNSEPIHRRNAQAIVAPVYTRVIGPGTADIAHYRLTVPSGQQQLTVEARLLWRKFDRTYTEFAYQANPLGFAAFDSVPDLPITEIDRHSVQLRIGSSEVDAVASAHDANQDAGAPEWMRYNDYGIGLLLQGDTRGAAQAFATVARLAPERVDGERNLARAALRDGDLDRAWEHLERCEQIVPGNAQTAWFWGVAHQKAGNYNDAERAYRHVLQRFPEDRAAWRNLGRILYLDERYDEALRALSRVLRLDPEDRSAHYHRMLALRALGRDDEAAAAEEAYAYYQIDESAQSVTREYRQRDGDANREAQSIHAHELGVQKMASGDGE